MAEFDGSVNTTDVPPGYSLEFSGILIAVLSWVRLMNQTLLKIRALWSTYPARMH